MIQTGQKTRTVLFSQHKNIDDKYCKKLKMTACFIPVTKYMFNFYHWFMINFSNLHKTWWIHDRWPDKNYEATDSDGKCLDEEMLSFDLWVTALWGSEESLELDTALDDTEEETRFSGSARSEYDSCSW